MKTTIVYAHPWNESLNKAVLDKVIDKLNNNGDEITLIDLYKDNFNPVMSEKDLSLYSQGKSADPLVDRYNTILDNTEKIIFIFPIWWYDMPAIMRGFLDKVLLNQSAYTEDDMGMHPVRNVQHTYLFTTSSAPTTALIEDFGDPINGTVIKGTFEAVGFFNAKWYNCDRLKKRTKEEINDYLGFISNEISI